MQLTKSPRREEGCAEKIYRRATPADGPRCCMAEWKPCMLRAAILNLNLSMKLSDVDYQAGQKQSDILLYRRGPRGFPRAERSLPGPPSQIRSASGGEVVKRNV